MSGLPAWQLRLLLLLLSEIVLVLLFKLGKQPPLNVAEMSVLQPSQLHQLLWPDRMQLAVLPTG